MIDCLYIKKIIISNGNAKKKKVYFAINKITEEKINLMEKYSGLNLSEIRNKLKN